MNGNKKPDKLLQFFFYVSVGMSTFSILALLGQLIAAYPLVREGISSFLALLMLIISVIFGLYSVFDMWKAKGHWLKLRDVFLALAPVIGLDLVIGAAIVFGMIVGGEPK